MDKKGKDFKVLTGCHGQIGDLVIGLIACRALRQKYPDCHITYSINQKYQSVLPVFLHNELIDDFYISENYDNWPSPKDLEYLATHRFDIFNHPNQPNRDNFWWLRCHHSEAYCENFGLTPPEDLQINLTQWFDLLPQYKDCVAITPFTSAGARRDIPEILSNEIVAFIHSLGFETIQLGLGTAPRLNTTYPTPGGAIFDDVVIARSCKALITADTGMNYIMSGYQHPTLGLYCSSFYPMKAPLINRVPKNPNSIYLEAEEINLIDKTEIFANIRKILTE